MSRVFYDKLIKLEKVEEYINRVAETNEQKQEMWGIVDSMIHYKMMDLILQKLQQDLHEDFIQEFTKKPHDKEHFTYLAKHVGEDIRTFLKLEMERFTMVILKELHSL